PLMDHPSGARILAPKEKLSMNHPDLPLSWCAHQVVETMVWEFRDDLLPHVEPIIKDLVTRLGFGLAEVLKEVSDETLALAIKKNFLYDAAFAQLLVDRYHPYLIRWFTTWGARHHQSEDLFGDLVHKILRNGLENFDPLRNFRSYLHRAARNM